MRGEPVTVATDVYALGVLLYRLITGRSPYRPPLDTETDVMRAVREQVPEPPSAAPDAATGRIPDDVDRIVLKALRKEPERRYGSVGQFADDVQRFLDGRPVLAAPDSLRYRAGKFVAAACDRRRRGGGRADRGDRRRGRDVVAGARGRARAAAGAARSSTPSGVSRGRCSASCNDAVRKLPGSTAASEILLRRATEYLDALYAQATDDVALRREVADGYIRLAARCRAWQGLPNSATGLDDARVFRRRIAMLEPIAAPDRGDLRDRLNLANSLGRLSTVEPVETQANRAVERARQIVEALSPAERSTQMALLIRQMVWDEVAQPQRRRSDYHAAYHFFDRMREAAEEAFGQTPDNLDASRNLSLAYKRTGALLETMRRVPEAMTLYEKALDLDRRRVAIDPARSIWRLDLSFSYGSLGAAVMNTDPETALGALRGSGEAARAGRPGRSKRRLRQGLPGSGLRAAGAGPLESGTCRRGDLRESPPSAGLSAIGWTRIPSATISGRNTPRRC